MKNILATLVLILYSFSTIAQIQVLQSRSIGGSNRDSGVDLCVGSHEDLVICAATASFDGDIQTTINGLSDAWIIWVDTLMSIRRSLTFGGNGDDGTSRILKIDPNLFVIYGLTSSTDWPTGPITGYADYDLLS